MRLRETRDLDGRRRLLVLVDRLVQLQRFRDDDVITAATHLREWARGTFFLATAFDALGQKAEAERTLDELIARYVSADPVPPPGMHARLALELAELDGLVRSVLGERAATALATIRDAPPLSEDGDFL